MSDSASAARERLTAQRVLLALATGVVAGVLVGVFGVWEVAPVAGWIVAATAYLIGVWSRIARMDAATTASHATREDPTRTAGHVIVLVASLASLAGVALLLAHSGPPGRTWNAVLGFGSVAASWLVVHTLYTLQYAAIYYEGPDGGVDFNQPEPPAYLDFAYLGFTLGMTYQVSDTDISSSAIRHTALRHALLSYLLGAVVLGISINLIAGLAA